MLNWLKQRRGIWLPGLVLAGGLGVAACDELEPLSAEQCGNGVVEAGEDCDGTFAGVACRGPDQENPCRFDCSTSSDQCDAAAGFRCGSDGVCRRPRGTFAEVPVSLAPALTLSAHDFDGDGRDELLSADGRNVVVTYLDDDGSVAEQRQIPTTDVHPVVADVVGDRHLDVALLTELGVQSKALGLLEGTDNGFAPVSFTTVDYGLSEAANASLQTIGILGDEALSAPIIRTAEGIALVLPFISDETFPIYAGEARPEQGYGLARGNISGGPPEIGPCEELFVGRPDGVDVVVPCFFVSDDEGSIWVPNLIGAQGFVAPIPIRLPPGRALEPAGPSEPKRIFATDVTADGFLDVVFVSVNADDPGGSEPRIELSRGDGAGSFDPVAQPLEVDFAFRCSEEGRLFGARGLLDVVDLSGDGLFDLVMIDGIYLQTEGGPFVPSTCAVFGWGASRRGDINGDGVVDIVVEDLERGILEALVNVRGGAFTRFPVSKRPARFFQTADVD
ncbi:MAG: VCBS repeat-containing protein, partial [Myxococcota bacterium]